MSRTKQRTLDASVATKLGEADREYLEAAPEDVELTMVLTLYEPPEDPSDPPPELEKFLDRVVWRQARIAWVQRRNAPVVAMATEALCSTGVQIVDTLTVLILGIIVKGVPSALIHAIILPCVESGELNREILLES